MLQGIPKITGANRSDSQLRAGPPTLREQAATLVPLTGTMNFSFHPFAVAARRLALCAFAFLSIGLTAIAHAAQPTPALAPSPAKIAPLAVGATVPSATVTTLDGATVDLATLGREKPTVLIFYRGSWCPYCNTHLAELAELEPQLLALGYQILAVSPDSAVGLKKAIEKNHLNYRLLSDAALHASSAFGVAFRLDEKTVKTYTGYGIALAPIPGETNAYWLPVPAVFIVGRDGVIRFAHTDPNYKARLSGPDLLAAAHAAAR